MDNTTRIKDLIAINTPNSNDVFPLDGDNGTNGISFQNLSKALTNECINSDIEFNGDTTTIIKLLNTLYTNRIGTNAGGHNSIYRGNNLGTAYTATMSETIRNGTFDNLFIGDYFTINGTVYRVAGFNLIANDIDNQPLGNNVCIVPDSPMYSAQMRNTDTGAYISGDAANTTAGAYANSNMRRSNLANATQKIINDFGSDHVLHYGDMLANSVNDSGVANGWSLYNCQVELMSETMLLGTTVWATSGLEVGCMNSQIPLFSLAPQLIHTNTQYFLRNVRDALAFSGIDARGFASAFYSSTPSGVRPFFFIN